jgi:uncharacterized protein YceH (UPF0502 family)
LAVAGPLDATEIELRVLGCLIEKQRTTPDAYPLSLNSLRLACNQSTNRDPVVEYDEATVREAAQRLSRRGWARLASRGGRAVKYRHLFDEALGLADDQTALLAVLMLRGPQTPGELKQRVERMHRFEDLGAVHEALDRLIERSLVADEGRRPGQKETRYAHTLAAGAGDGEPAAETAPAPSPSEPGGGPRDERVDRLEREVEALREELAELRGRLDGADRVQG